MRIHSVSGTLVGAGVLVSDTDVLTCAHVVLRALDRTEAGLPDPVAAATRRRPLRVDTPIDGVTWSGRATVAPNGWFHGHSPWDVAVLRLDTPAPPPLDSAPLARTKDAIGRGRTVSVRDPADPHDGDRTYGVLCDRGGPNGEYVRLDACSPRLPTATPGLSGSGVRDTVTGEVLGIVSDIYHSARGVLGAGAWMVPIGLVPPMWEDPAPARSEARSTPSADTAAEHPLAEALLAVPTIMVTASRQVFHHFCLDPRIRKRIRFEESAEAYATALVRTCRAHGRLETTLRMIEALESGGVAMAPVWEAARPLLTRYQS